MSKKSMAWLILVGSLMSGAGGVLFNWDGSNWRALMGGLLMSLGGVLVASFNKSVNDTVVHKPIRAPKPKDPDAVQPIVRR